MFDSLSQGVSRQRYASYQHVGIYLGRNDLVVGISCGIPKVGTIQGDGDDIATFDGYSGSKPQTRRETLQKKRWWRAASLDYATRIETLEARLPFRWQAKASEPREVSGSYAPLQPIKNLGSGETYNAPCAARIFGLANTHIIRHVEDVELGQLQFHIWSLGFFTGQRLSATEAGFLDVTPLKPGKLNDFVLLGDSLSKAVQLAETYWQDNAQNRKQLARFEAAIHALFLAQNPRLFQFEGFMFLYTALDACFAIMKDMLPGPYPNHQQRTKWMCDHYGVPVPDWADSDGETEITALRNPTIHEGLYLGEPLGFAIEGRGSNRNLNLQIQAVVCRLLVAIIGGAETDYVKSAVTSRQNIGLRLL